MTARRDGSRIVLPGLATAHSHAFQRALRGRAQRRSGSFRSCRGLMYALARALGPEDVHAIYKALSAESHRFTIAAAFGNVHGVVTCGRAAVRACVDARARACVLG